MKKLVIFDFGRTLFDNERGAFFPEVAEVIEHLRSRGYQLAIVSYVDLSKKSTPQLRAKALREAGLFDLFASVLFTTVSPEDKDRLFEQVLRELDAVPGRDQIAVVDDHLHRGVRWGNAKPGVMTFWLCQGKFSSLRPDKETGEPFRTITSLEQLKWTLS